MNRRLVCVMLFLVACLLCAGVSAQTETGGLAESAWPKFGQNAGNTGLSPNVGPQTPTVKWRINAGQEISCPPALKVDGDLCLSVGDRLYVLGPDGGAKLQYLTASLGRSAPAVARDGTVYVGSAIGTALLAIAPAPPEEGGTAEEPSLTFAWRFATGSGIHSPPAIGPTGAIYFGCDDGYLYAVNPDGTARWTYEVGTAVKCSPAVAPDGTIYVIDGEFGLVLHAVGPDGASKWLAGIEWGSEFFPAIRADGSIVLCVSWGQVTAISEAGEVVWAYEPPDDGPSPSTGPAIGPRGEVYYGTEQGVLCALTPEGTPAWGCVLGEAKISTSPTVDAEGTVYVGTNEGLLCAVGADGQIRWRQSLGSAVTSSPVIGAGGALYVGCADGSLYAIGQ